jgi:hypothetical protein
LGVRGPRVRELVKKLTSECLICQKVKWQKMPQVESKHHLHGIAPMISLSADTIGPLPEDQFGNKYILVITCNFTKYCELFPVKSTSAMEYVHSMIKHIGNFGIPKFIRTDGGTQFTAEVSQELAKMFKFEHLVIVPYHPEANGIVERKNAEIMKHLRAMVYARGIKGEWSNYLPLIQRLLNFTVDFSIGESPAKVLFGDMIPTNVHIDMMDAYDGVLVSSYLTKLKEAQRRLVKASLIFLDGKAKSRDEKGNKQDESTPLVVGDYVLLIYPNKPPNKLAGRYRGPMQIHEVLREDIFKVLDLVNNKIYQIHKDRLLKLRVNTNVTKPEMIQIAGLDIDEHLVHDIVDHKGSKKQKNLKFRVRWEGYEPDDDTWEPWAEVKHLERMDSYLADHPEIKV